MRIGLILAVLWLFCGLTARGEQAVEITSTDGTCSCFDDPLYDECKDWKLTASTCKDVDKCCEDANGNKICCLATAIGPSGPLCAGGETIFYQEQPVGCAFNKFKDPEKAQCAGRKVIKPDRFTGTCWVCVEEERVALVLEPTSWGDLRISDQEANSREANFSCLRGSRVVDRSELQAFPAGLGVSRPGLEIAPEIECPGQWTPWLNRDTPGGSGDYETLRDYVKVGKTCHRPAAVECRTTRGVAWGETGEVVRCDTEVGAYCVNREQERGRSCSDYEVRFCC